MTKKQEKEGFRIVCDRCNRVACNYQFTFCGDLVVYCKTCGQAEMVFKEGIQSDNGGFL